MSTDAVFHRRRIDDRSRSGLERDEVPRLSPRGYRLRHSSDPRADHVGARHGGGQAGCGQVRHNARFRHFLIPKARSGMRRGRKAAGADERPSAQKSKKLFRGFEYAEGAGKDTERRQAAEKPYVAASANRGDAKSAANRPKERTRRASVTTTPIAKGGCRCRKARTKDCAAA